MTREEFMDYARTECNAVSSRLANRMMNVVERVWAESAHQAILDYREKEKAITFEYPPCEIPFSYPESQPPSSEPQVDEHQISMEELLWGEVLTSDNTNERGGE